MNKSLDDNLLQFPLSDPNSSWQEPRQRAAAFSWWELTGMVKSINELYCILSSPASLRMHACMLNIWICIGIEHLLSVSQSCALNNNLTGKWTASSLPQTSNWKRYSEVLLNFTLWWNWLWNEGIISKIRFAYMLRILNCHVLEFI